MKEIVSALGGKKIIFSLFAIVTVSAMIIGGTVAYFSDTETSTNNTFANGTMDLNINGGNIAVQTMNLSDKAPGDNGKESSVLKNVGSLTGELDIAMGTVVNYPCTDDVNGGKNDGTEYCNADAGTLGGNMAVAPYLDINKNGSWDTGDIGLKSDVSTYINSGLTVLDYDVIDNYSGVIWNPAAVTMATNSEYNFAVDWKILTTAGNEIQGDALKFDVMFTLEQADKD